MLWMWVPAFSRQGSLMKQKWGRRKPANTTILCPHPPLSAFCIPWCELLPPNSSLLSWTEILPLWAKINPSLRLFCSFWVFTLTKVHRYLVNIISPFLKLLLEETNIWFNGLSKADGLLQCGQTSFNALMTEIKPKGQERWNSLYVSWKLIFYVCGALGFQGFRYRLQPTPWLSGPLDDVTAGNLICPEICQLP